MLIAALLATTLLTADMPDPIAQAQTQFAQTESYRVTIRSTSADGKRNVIHYSYRKPGYIRMDFVQPHPGAALVYNPTDRKVRLRPFGPTAFPLLTLSPSDALIRDPSGHQVDQSDVGTLLHNAHSLQQNGGTVSQESTTLNGKPALRLDITGAPGQRVQGVHRYQIWLGADGWFPVRVISYGENGKTLETVSMDNAQINPRFAEHFFDL